MEYINSILSFIANFVGILAVICPIFIIGFRQFKILYNKRSCRPECVTEDEVKKYTRIYIQTRLVRNGETLYAYKFIDNLLKTTEQYYLILGDTGSGKSSFLLNCYFYFLLKVFKKGYGIYFFSLRDKLVLNKINAIENKKNTILLLDSFDESIQATQNAHDSIKQIENNTKEFSKIIITSRAHFFNNKEDEPNIVANFKAIDLEETKYQKYYITHFTDDDIKKYLFKKYGLEIKKQRQAFSTVHKCHDLMSRPLILSYIDSILDSSEKIKYSYEIYNIIIRNIINREVQYLLKSTSSESEESVKDLTENYWRFLDEISIKMYYNISNYNEPIIEQDIVDSYKISLSNKNIKRNRALLERKYNDFLTFSHRSIFEYFIAKNIMDIKCFKFEPNLTQTYLFLAELYNSGNENMKNFVILKDEEWYFNMKLFDTNGALVTYGIIPENEMVFEFVNKENDFIYIKLYNIFEVICNLQSHLYKIKNKLAVSRIDIITINLQHSISKENVNYLLNDLKENLNLIINETKNKFYTIVQIEGRYEELYKF